MELWRERLADSSMMIDKAIQVIVKGKKTASMTMDEVAEVPNALWCDNTTDI